MDELEKKQDQDLENMSLDDIFVDELGLSSMNKGAKELSRKDKIPEYSTSCIFDEPNQRGSDSRQRIITKFKYYRDGNKNEFSKYFKTELEKENIFITKPIVDRLLECFVRAIKEMLLDGFVVSIGNIGKMGLYVREPVKKYCPSACKYIYSKRKISAIFMYSSAYAKEITTPQTYDYIKDLYDRGLADFKKWRNYEYPSQGKDAPRYWYYGSYKKSAVQKSDSNDSEGS